MLVTLEPKGEILRADEQDQPEIYWAGDEAFVVAATECFEFAHRTQASATNPEGVSSLCQDCGHVFAQAIRDGHPDPAEAVLAIRSWTPPERGRIVRGIRPQILERPSRGAFAWRAQ